jgi:hypothetical protein
MDLTVEIASREEVSRRVRMPVSGVSVEVGDHRVELLNLSVSGALFSLDSELPVGTDWMLSFHGADHMLTVNARVTWVSRLEHASQSGGTQIGYTAGVAFLDQSAAAQRTILQFYVQVVRQKD